MNRLTFYDNGKPAFKYQGCVYKIEVANKLAAYEDSGLEPGEVRELEHAKKDGRLVMLPCKVGADIYRLGKKEVCDYWQIAKAEIYEDEIILEDDSENVIFPENIGKTVFLTREEAEAALEAQKGSGNE